MSSQTFHSCVCNTFLPYLRQKGVKFPILYFLDGHKSHLTYNLSKFCAENGIFLFALYPNATHILQPADVSLFAPLKANWRTIVLNWKRSNNNKQVNKATFPLLLENATQQVKAETVQNGFRKCGLYPYNVEAIDFKKCMKDTSRILGENEENDGSKVKPTEFKIPHFLYFESIIPLNRRQEFKNAGMGEWNGDESAKELFEIWRKLKNRCKIRNTKEIENGNTEENKNQMVREENDNIETEESNIIATEGGIDNTETEIEINTSRDSKKDMDNTGTENEAEFTKAGEDNNVSDTDNEHFEAAKKDSNKLFERPMTPEPTTSNTNQKCQNKRISTSFLDHIFWPEESPEKKNQVTKKERLPYASTSERWLQYHKNKENLKIQKEEEKQKRAINNRIQKKIVKQKKNKKSKYEFSESDSEEWSESGTSLDDISEEHFTSDIDEPLAKIAEAEKKIREGDFYLVSFPGKKKGPQLCLHYSKCSE